MGTLNTMEWSLVSESPWPGGNSMKCTVTDPPGGSSSYLYSNDLSVLPGQMLQLHFWTKLVQPEGENLPKFELIFSGGGALELDSGGEASDDMRLRPLPGHQLLPKAADWTEAQQTFRVPLGVTTMSIMIRLQGASTATWWITGVELLNLDASLRNIIRTGDTDIELVDASTGLQYELGTDFVVNNPKTENTAHHLCVPCFVNCRPVVVSAPLCSHCDRLSRAMQLYRYAGRVSHLSTVDWPHSS